MLAAQGRGHKAVHRSHIFLDSSFSRKFITHILSLHTFTPSGLYIAVADMDTIRKLFFLEPKGSSGSEKALPHENYRFVASLLALAWTVSLVVMGLSATLLSHKKASVALDAISACALTLVCARLWIPANIISLQSVPQELTDAVILTVLTFE
jgi:hypothetical protein